MGGLSRSDPKAPGYSRRRAGRGYRYSSPDGRAVRDPEVLARIKGLVIPPARRNVWICTDSAGHIQATGTDAAGRRQYMEQEQWRADQDRLKFDQVLEFGAALPQIRSTVGEALAGRGLTRERVLAAAVRLIDLGFSGPEGRSTRQRTGRSAWPLSAGHDVTAANINSYVQEISGREFTAKDFRTWNATVLAAVGLAVSQSVSEPDSARKRAVVRVVAEVAQYLGNTPAVARSSYIDPRVIQRYEDGEKIQRTLGQLGARSGFGDLSTEGRPEAAVLRLLRE